MANYFTVLKLLIKNMFLPDKSKKEKRGGKIVVIIALGISYLFIAGLIVLMILLFGQSFMALGLINEFITILWGIAAFIVLFFGIVSLLNYLYFSRDTEFFLSLPIKPSTIYFAKFTVVYLTELAIAALLLIPALLTAGIVVGAGAFYYFIGFIGLIFAPSIPLMIASAIAVPLMYIVSFFKNKGALSSIVLILLFGLFFGVYFILVSKISSFMEGAEDPDLVVEAMRKGVGVMANVLYPFLALSRLATFTPVFGLGVGASMLVNAVIFFGSVAALFAISVFITNFVYKRGAASQMENVKKKGTGKEKFVSGSALKALVKKEWKELIRTPSFAYQCLSSVVLAPLIVAIFSFTGLSGISNAGGEEFPVPPEFLKSIGWFFSYGFLLIFGVGFNIAASTAITREGKNFYFSKQMPVAYATQLLAKKIVCFIISFVSCALSLILLTVATKDVINMFIGLVFAVLYSYGFICFSIFYDLRKPKLDWSVPNEAVKQNFRMIIPYLFNIVIAVIFIVMPMLLLGVMASYVAALATIWSIMFAFGIAVAITFHILLAKNAERFYDRLSV